MNSVAAYDNPSNGFSGQSDFSATVGSACSSEEMLYRVFSDNMFLEEDNTKKTVKFGDVFVEDEVPLYEAESPKDNNGNLLISMFAHAHEKDAKAFKLPSNEYLSEEDEEILSSKDNCMLYPNRTIERFSEFSSGNDSPILENSPTNTRCDTVSEKHLRNKLETQESQASPSQTLQDRNNYANNDEDLELKSSCQSPSRNSRAKKKTSRQKAILKDQNQKLLEQTIALNSCISVQQQTINNYESLVTDIQQDFKNLKTNYELSLQENMVSGQNLEAAIQAFESTKIQLDALSKIKEFQIPPDNIASKFGNVFAYSEQNYEIMRNLIYELQHKNNCLDEVCTLLSKKMNSMYRYTIAPALHLAGGDVCSQDELLNFDSNNSIQEYMDANFTIFENIHKLTRVGESGEDDEIKKKRVLGDIENYFDNLNSLVVDQLEKLVRRKP